MRISVLSMPNVSLRWTWMVMPLVDLAVGESHEEMYHILDGDRAISAGE